MVTFNGALLEAAEEEGEEEETSITTEEALIRAHPPTLFPMAHSFISLKTTS